MNDTIFLIILIVFAVIDSLPLIGMLIILFICLFSDIHDVGAY